MKLKRCVALENLRLLLWASLMLYWGEASPVSAQEFSLLRPDIPVVKISARGSEVKFEDGALSLPEAAVKELKKEVGEDAVARISYQAVHYSSLGVELPPGVGTYDAPKSCQSSEVRQSPVMVESDELEWFDILFYSYADPQQSAKAGAWELPTAPYLEGDLYNPHRIVNKQQEIGRVFGVRCLPTRFHFVTVDGVQMLEFREGERAWDRITE